MGHRGLAHSAEIMLGMLEVILRDNLVAAERLGAGERKVALIISLRVLALLRALRCRCISAAMAG